jgi:hypothetical protein
MAESKNMFLQSRMNKDVDERILPNGEYRDAQNISINRSEGADVGALENIKGNELIQTITPEGHTAIGLFMDETNDCMYIFTTDYSGSTIAPASASCAIYRYIPGSTGFNTLVSGSFLNFSTLSPVYGISMLENLLFFTDNRNQPRVINVNTALSSPGYYTKEEHISVAKFSPYLPISAVVEENRTVLDPGVDATTFKIAGIDNTIAVGDYAVDESTEIASVLTPSFLGIVISVTKATDTVITVDQNSGTAILAGDIIKFSRTTMSDQFSDPSWKGDPDFLEDKFVRFSYRFKYADNEYSLIAPFTQVMFIPKQDGFFLGEAYVVIGDRGKNEADAYKSTILSWMENKANNIELYIPFPSNNPLSDYKIQEVDILYKESDAIAIKVLQTVPISSVTFEDEYAADMNYFKYTYQSKKPYKTLPSADTTRVSDKVPVRALAQDVVSNRVVYGNYVNRNNAPSSLDYNIFVNSKNPASSNFTTEYPNHSLKQNRNYEVGVVLYDKFGRASSVLLSTIIDGVNASEPTSTIYHPYKESGWGGPLNWYGDTLQIRFNSPIQETPTQSYVGTYAQPTSFVLEDIINTTTITSTSPYEYTITGGDFTTELSPINGAGLNNYLRGYHVDFTKIISASFNGSDTVITTEEQIADIYNFTGGYGATNRENKYVYTINPLGWYSYRVVVKQTEQDYYNAYLPGFLNGNPSDATPISPNEVNEIANVVLIGDNINKIPRDLTEVGPDQQQYRSSNTRLYVRVENTAEHDDNSATNPLTIQYYPGRNNFIATTIGSEQELYNNNPAGTYTSFPGFYQNQSNPLLARVSTNTPLGIVATAPPYETNGENLPRLSILETEPVTSLLDIYWETSTGGLIVDLNELINKTLEGVSGLSPDPTTTSSFIESTDYSVLGGVNVADPFNLLDIGGNPIAFGDSSGSIVSVINGAGTNVTANNWFTLTKNTSGTFDEYYLKCVNNFAYLEVSPVNQSFDITMQFIKDGIGTSVSVNIPLQNAQCSISTFPIEGTPDNPGIISPVPAAPATTNIYQFAGLENGATNVMPLSNRLDDLFFEVTSQYEVTQSGIGYILTPISSIFFMDSIQIDGTSILKCNKLEKKTYKVNYELKDANGQNAFTSVTKSVYIGASAPVPFVSTVQCGTAQYGVPLSPNPLLQTINDDFGDGLTVWARHSGFALDTITNDWSVCSSASTEGIQVAQIVLNNLTSTLPAGYTSFRLAMEIVTPNPLDANGNENQFDLSTLTNKDDIKWQFFKANNDLCGSNLGTEIFATENTLDTTKATLVFDESDLNFQGNFRLTQLIRNIFTETEGNCCDGPDTNLNPPIQSSLKGQVYIKYTLAVNDNTLVPDPWNPGSELIAENTVRYVVNTMQSLYSNEGLNNSLTSWSFICTPTPPLTCP